MDLSTFLTAHIIPELSAESVNARPVVKAAVIKFITTFRAQFTAEQLTALVPMLSVFVASTGFVVHTYAATALERLLSVKDRVESGVCVHAPTRALVRPLCETALYLIVNAVQRVGGCGFRACPWTSSTRASYRC